jgi:hypothetical protein
MSCFLSVILHLVLFFSFFMICTQGSRHYDVWERGSRTPSALIYLGSAD